MDRVVQGLPPFQLENPHLTFGTAIDSSQNLRRPQKSVRTFALRTRTCVSKIPVQKLFLCLCAISLRWRLRNEPPFYSAAPSALYCPILSFISFRDCNIPLALSAVFNANQVSPKLFSSTTSYVLRFWLRARWHNVIGIHGAGGTAVVCWSGYSTLPPSLPSTYLARLIWSHLPLLYYTHCVMVEDGIWKKIWLIRDRVYEQEKSLLEMAQSSFGFTRKSFERSY